MDLIFGYLAGLLTLINPCVLPVLPIVLVGALNASKAGPLALAAGMSVLRWPVIYLSRWIKGRIAR